MSRYKISPSDDPSAQRLACAVIGKDEGGVRASLAAGAQPNVMWVARAQSLLATAVEAGCGPIVEALLAAGADPLWAPEGRSNGWAQLLSTGDVARVNDWLDRFPALSRKEGICQGLRLAVGLRQDGVWNALLARWRSLPEVPDWKNTSVLEMSQGALRLNAAAPARLRALLTQVCSPTRASAVWWDVLQQAVWHKNEGCVRWLLAEKGAMAPLAGQPDGAVLAVRRAAIDVDRTNLLALVDAKFPQRWERAAWLSEVHCAVYRHSVRTFDALWTAAPFPPAARLAALTQAPFSPIHSGPARSLLETACLVGYVRKISAMIVCLVDRGFTVHDPSDGAGPLALLLKRAVLRPVDRKPFEAALDALERAGADWDAPIADGGGTSARQRANGLKGLMAECVQGRLARHAHQALGGALDTHRPDFLPRRPRF